MFQHFLKKIEKEQIMNAIHDAELRTSGEIRVHVEHCCGSDALRRGQEVFVKLGMANTALHNGVLIYLAVKDHKFAIIGDEGINNALPANFWDETKNQMEQLFRAGRFAEGVCLGVESAGRHLAQYFPRQADDVNELPNEISQGIQ